MCYVEADRPRFWAWPRMENSDERLQLIVELKSATYDLWLQAVAAGPQFRSLRTAVKNSSRAYRPLRDGFTLRLISAIPPYDVSTVTIVETVLDNGQHRRVSVPGPIRR